MNQVKISNYWTRLKSDVNGNSRYTTSWCGFGFQNYQQAVRAANAMGGRKYNTKQFGGCLVFQAQECELGAIEIGLRNRAAQ